MALLAIGIATAASAVAVPRGVPAPTSHAPTVAPAPPTAAPGSPNVVFILTDDMRADELGNLPNVQRLLIAEGRRYPNAYAPHPLCCPSRAELLTGQFGQNNGVRHNEGPWGGYQALEDPGETLAAWLTDAGYATYYTGKYLNGYRWDRGLTEADTPRPPGWSVWDPIMVDPHEFWDYGFWNGDESRGRYVTELVTERTNEAIDTFHEDGRPFFLFVNHLAPHGTDKTWPGTGRRPQYPARYADDFRAERPPHMDHPSYNEADVSDLPEILQAPLRDKVWLGRYEKLWRARQRALQTVDASVASIVARLKATGELDNTYIVFTSDNGWQLGEHRLMSKNHVFAESLRIPLVVRGPGIAPDTVNRSSVTLVDLPPTFLEWTDAAPRRTPDGLPLSAFDGQRGSGPVRDTVLIQTGDDDLDSTPGWRFRGVLAGPRYTYAEEAGNPVSGVLFDHRFDPYETVNLFQHPAYAAIRAELSRRTAVLQECAGPDCNQVFGALPPPGTSSTGDRLAGFPQAGLAN